MPRKLMYSEITNNILWNYLCPCCSCILYCMYIVQITNSSSYSPTRALIVVTTATLHTAHVSYYPTHSVQRRPQLHTPPVCTIFYIMYSLIMYAQNNTLLHVESDVCAGACGHTSCVQYVCTYTCLLETLHVRFLNIPTWKWYLHTVYESCQCFNHDCFKGMHV